MKKFDALEMFLAIVLAVIATAVLIYVTLPPSPAEVGTALVCDRVDDVLVVCVER